MFARGMILLQEILLCFKPRIGAKDKQKDRPIIQSLPWKVPDPIEFTVAGTSVFAPDTSVPSFEVFRFAKNPDTSPWRHSWRSFSTLNIHEYI